MKYVLTDVAPANLKFMATRRVLAPFFAQGLLDVARFDAETDTDLFLELARRRLAPGTLANPLVVIANYVFDGLSQDVFHAAGGELQQSLVTTVSPTGPIDVAAAEPFASLDLRFALSPIEGAFYTEPELERTLRRQAQETDGTFTFPCAVLRAIRRLAALAGGRLCLIAADWNDHVERPARPPGDPRVSRHGSFSLAVNFKALADHVEEAGGLTLKMRHQHRQLEQAAFVLAPPPAGLPELSAAFALRIAESGPDDLSTLRRNLSLQGMDVGQLLALVRVWHHDPGVLRDVLPLIVKDLATTTPVGRREIVRTVERVLESYYPIGELPDLALESAALFYRMGEHAKALALLETSLGDWEETALVRFNMGLCCLALRDTAQAKAHFDRAFALEPGFQAANAFQK